MSASEIKSRRKELKDEIKAWLEEFELRNGRPPTDLDKQAISYLYEERKELEGGRESTRGKDSSIADGRAELGPAPPAVTFNPSSWTWNQ